MTAAPRVFVNSINIPLGATPGYVLSSDGSGNAAWVPSQAANDVAAAFFLAG